MAKTNSKSRSDSGAEVPLHQMIESLRAQLEKSRRSAEGKDLYFTMDKVELELKVVATRQDDVEGGIGWSIFKVGAKATNKDEAMHTLKLSLKLHSKSSDEGREGEVKLTRRTGKKSGNRL